MNKEAIKDYALLSAVAIMMFAMSFIMLGCNSDTYSNDTYYLDDNGSIMVPKDENTSITDMTEGTTITVQGDYYVIDGSGNVTIVQDNGQVGDTTTNTADNNSTTN